MKTDLKTLREDIGLTQGEVSKKLNISQPAVSQIENQDHSKNHYKQYLKLLVENGADINKLFK